jgi:hypothetical protein
LKGYFVSKISTASTYSQALDLISSSTQATIFRINQDGSLRKQTFSEKAVDFFAGRIVGRFQARKDSKDAQVAQALVRLHRDALNSENVLDRSLATDTPIEQVSAFSRFFEARNRLEPRRITTGEPNICRASLASLSQSTQALPALAQTVTDSFDSHKDIDTGGNVDTRGDVDTRGNVDTHGDLAQIPSNDIESAVETSCEIEEEEFFDAEERLIVKSSCKEILKACYKEIKKTEPLKSDNLVDLLQYYELLSEIKKIK